MPGKNVKCYASPGIKGLTRLIILQKADFIEARVVGVIFRLRTMGILGRITIHKCGMFVGGHTVGRHVFLHNKLFFLLLLTKK